MRTLIAALAVAFGLMVPAEAATLYITEFANGLSIVGSTQPQIPPEPPLADQAVAVGGGSVASAAFNAKTHAIMVVCDVGCSISIGAAPTATALNYLLPQLTPTMFGVVPGQAIAVIANTAGNSPAGAANASVAATGAAVPGSATYIGGNKAGNLVGLTLDGSSNLNVTIAAASASNISVNEAQINGVTPLMGNGVTGTGSQRVTIASDNTAFAVTASGTSTAADGAVLTNALKTWDILAGYNGTTADLIRSGDVNNIAAATGYVDALGVARYNATLPTLTDTRYNALQVGARGSLHTEIWASDSGVPVAVSASNADAVANATVTFNVSSRGSIFNGTTWDRMDGVANGTNSTGTGILAAGHLGQCDDTTPATITENSFGNTRMGCTDHSALVGGSKAGVATALALDSSGNLLVAGSGSAGTPATGVVTVQGATGQVPVFTTPTVATISTSVTRPADTNAYTAGDAFANSTTVPTSGGFTWTSACRASGGFGTITDMVVSASAKSAYVGEVWVFDQAGTAINDNAVFDVSTTDVLKVVGVIPFSIASGIAQPGTDNTTALSYVTGVNLGYTCVGTANLRFLVKLTAAVTPGNAEVVQFRIHVLN